MSQLALYGIGISFSFVAWGLVTAWYIWPELRRHPRADALRPLLLLHCFRFIGLAFLVPGVVSPDLPAAFASPAAYGTVRSSPLALAAAGQAGPCAFLCSTCGHRGLSRLLSGQTCWARRVAGAAYFIVTISCHCC